MRWTFLVAIATLAGCSTDASGLGGDVVGDAHMEDSTFGGDETRPLFDADDDTGSIVVDSGDSIDTLVVVDTSVPDTATPDTELDTTPPIDTDVPETAVDSAVDDGDAAYPIDVMESDGGLATSPGRVVCSEGGVDKLCASGEVCCNSGGWKCAGSCGTLGLGGYKCDEKADCMGGQVCCADITPFIGTWNGSYCALAGTCWTAELCMKNADCSGGKVCSPIKPSGVPYTMGYCK